MMESEHPQVDTEAAEKNRQEKKRALADPPLSGARQIFINNHDGESQQIDDRQKN
jgi:hypothetical protein